MEDKKVLIISDFNQKTANGITIRSFFKTWPGAKIAVCDWSGSIENSYVEEITDYYILGKKEVCFIWPISLISNVNESSRFRKDSIFWPKLNKNYEVNLTYPRIRRTFIDFLQYTGLSQVRKKVKFSKELRNWIYEYKPDIVYSSFSTIYEINLLLKIKKEIHVPFIIHFFDDVQKSIKSLKLINYYWSSRINYKILSLINGNVLCLTVSPKMEHDFTNRYRKSFYNLFYPINPELFMANALSFTFKEFHTSEKKLDFTFVYTGKIDNDTIRPIKVFIKAIEDINKYKDYNIIFKIYSQYHLNSWIEGIGEKVVKYFHGKAEFSRIPEVLSQADALLLPLDDRPKSVSYTQLSMSTKAPEYMISNRPIFLLAPKILAVSEYLLSNECAYHSDINSSLKTNIIKFIENSKIRSQIAENAFYMALNNHTIECVGIRLRTLINNHFSNS